MVRASRLRLSTTICSGSGSHAPNTVETRAVAQVNEKKRHAEEQLQAVLAAEKVRYDTYLR